MYRILIIDDEIDILEFIKYNLNRDGYDVYTACNGREGVDKAIEIRPHLILLDMMMPVMNGIETCRAIREHEELRRTMIVFLSALNQEEQQLAGFGAGADDYITKPIRMTLLRSRVGAIMKRIEDEESQAGKSVAAAPHTPDIRLDREHFVVHTSRGELTMPRKEFALLELLVSSPGRLFTREEIYSRIWGKDVVVGDRTIDVHIRKLRQKIGNKRIVTIKGMGYKFE